MDEYLLIVAEAAALSEIETGIERAKRKIAVQPKDFDGNCVDCGSSILSQRLSFGAVTCLECQELREFKERRVHTRR